MAAMDGPVTSKESGIYELKDEYLDEIDPYFIWHTNTAYWEVQCLLSERLEKRAHKNGDVTEDISKYTPPKLDSIKSGPFQRIGMLLHAPLACQVLYSALLCSTYTANEHPRETILDAALQLIVLALEDGKCGAVAREIGGPDVANSSSNEQSTNRGGLWKYALELKYKSKQSSTPSSLLDLVLALSQKPEVKYWASKLSYICKLFREGGPRNASRIDAYFAKVKITGSVANNSDGSWCTIM
ncbi:E3 ubiquitin-protein ligase ubr1 [Coemansia spiralis]|uniref:E3 ubiquitin-protein ligase n=1 Tax=Coemansia spiralis TaxID=417178 RepID=A0A9W8G3Z5_9FUNG|nr:E3 ubiquitin-protein ligase ubr1 [Coemansia spiralis]